MTFDLHGQAYKIRGTLTLVAGDNLASHFLGGLSQVHCESADIAWLLRTTWLQRYTCIYMINQSKYVHPEQLSLFSKKKLPWVGFEPTTLRILDERSTMCRYVYISSMCCELYC